MGLTFRVVSIALAQRRGPSAALLGRPEEARMSAQENKRRIAEYFEALDARPEAWLDWDSIAVLAARLQKG